MCYNVLGDKMEELLLIMNDEGFIKHNGYEVITDGDKIKLKVNLKEISFNPYKIAHGGLIFGLGDTIMGIAARNSKGKNCVTLNSTIDFLKPGKGEFLIAEATVVKVGKTTCVVRTEIFNDEDDLIATMGGTYYYI